MIDLKPEDDKISEYCMYHQKIWDEVKEGMRDAGMLRCSIYLLGTRLVNILETEDSFDPETGFKRYKESRPKVSEWDQLMAEFQKPSPGAKSEEWWALMKLVFEYSNEEDFKYE